MISVRIRGIYSTALTKIFLDSGFKIIQPSEIIRERFGFADENKKGEVEPNLYVHDRMDRQGITVAGDRFYYKEIIKVLRSILDDAIFRGSLQASLGMMHPQIQVRESSLMQMIKASNMIGEHIDIEFPGLSKRRLDEIRNTVTPTVSGHHYYKACGGRISMMVDIAERMLREGCEREEVESLLRENVSRILPRTGWRISMEHAKIAGQTFNLGLAKIVRFSMEDRKMILLRRIFSKGVYDGLNVHKDKGDYAISEIRIGDLSFRTRYFSKDEEYKGTYININTPIELYPRKIRYVDLETDICVWPNGEVKRIDAEKLEDALSLGLISERLAEISKREIKKILNSISLEEERESIHFLSDESSWE